jgi:hypothetical protein
VSLEDVPDFRGNQNQVYMYLLMKGESKEEVGMGKYHRCPPE